MKKLIIYLILFSGLNMTVFAKFPSFFAKWDILLKAYTSPVKKDGINTVILDYKALMNDNIYSELIEDIKLFNPSKLETKEEKLAYWINMYNIGAAKMIIDNYPVKSIRDISKLTKSVWKKNIIEISGKDYFLSEIEDDILRKMGDERIHFAINCASLSCPNLRNEAYAPDILEVQLKEQTDDFLSDSTKGIKKKGNTIYISKIFKWFKEDFSNGNLYAYLNISKSDRIKYLKYDWSLNE